MVDSKDREKEGGKSNPAAKKSQTTTGRRKEKGNESEVSEVKKVTSPPITEMFSSLKGRGGK